MKSNRGVIYVLTNPYYKRNIVKIGKTHRTADVRALELAKPTGVPDKFEIVFDEIVSDVDKAEKAIHRKLEKCRVNSSREFFEISIRDAIKTVQSVTKEYEVHSDEETGRIDILPRLEARMRRWLREDLVSVTFHQFSDLCVVKWVTQPTLTAIDAIEHIFDLAVFACPDPDDEVLHRLYFSPVLNSPQENAARLVELDPYSMIMTGLDLLSSDAADHVAALWEIHDVEPTFPLKWKITDRKFEMWGENVFNDTEGLVSKSGLNPPTSAEA